MARFILFINSFNKYFLNTSSVPGTMLGARNPTGNMRNWVSILKTLMWKMGQIQENKHARAGMKGDGGRRPMAVSPLENTAQEGEEAPCGGKRASLRNVKETTHPRRASEGGTHDKELLT